MKNEESKNDIVIYQGEDGIPVFKVRIENETVWLTLEQMAQLFDKAKSTINEHILNIYKEGELVEGLTIQKIGNSDFLEKPTHYYNLDVIISVGYRVKSLRGTHFRQWATSRLREYIVKGFTMDDARLKESGGGTYWKELLERIRDIRSSEKALYRQVLDLYATSMDYDAKSNESIIFFKTVQNKLHYATNKQTAAELIFSRADAENDFMGMTTFAGSLPMKSETVVAKNYLNEDELFVLNRLVSAFFDLAEIKAKESIPMCMKDWVTELDKFSANYGKGVLKNAGTVSHDKAIEKAETEYKKYQVKTLSPVEKAYLDTIMTVQKKVEKKVKSDKPNRKK